MITKYDKIFIRLCNNLFVFLKHLESASFYKKTPATTIRETPLVIMIMSLTALQIMHNYWQISIPPILVTHPLEVLSTQDENELKIKATMLFGNIERLLYIKQVGTTASLNGQLLNFALYGFTKL